MDYPIVFLPGLFGSLGDDVIKGTGEFSFGFAEKIYRPFIEILNSMGYKENHNLFISYYDWKKPVLEVVDKYLFPDIEKIKKQTGYDKVILIGHSLGGLLGRAYMSYFSPSSVDKLILIASPNLGSVNAYCFWSGGKLPYSKVENNILYTGLKVGFILYYKIFKDINHLEALRNIFPIVRDLLPSYEYDNYLFYEKGMMEKEIPIKNMSINNEFLNLLERKPIDQDRLFIISGRGSSTAERFLVDINKKEKNIWQDGKPIKTYDTNLGDGTVTTISTLGYLGGKSIILDGNHTEILYKSKDFLSDILEKPLVKEIKQDKIEKIYIILVENCSKINISTPQVTEISNQNINIIDNKVQAIKLEQDNFLIMVTGDRNLKIELDTDERDKNRSKIQKLVLKTLS